jgi:hypothetical protein
VRTWLIDKDSARIYGNAGYRIELPRIKDKLESSHDKKSCQV